MIGSRGRIPHNYVYFGSEREGMRAARFLSLPALAGAQIRYSWRELEPGGPDGYDFKAVRDDLTFLAANNKRLFVQLQDVTFSPQYRGVPPYLLRDARYHGGADKQYSINGDDEKHAVVEGWVARRWDPAVRDRFHRLLAALGKEFDGRIEGINLPETSVTFGESGRLFPARKPRSRSARAGVCFPPVLHRWFTVTPC